METSYGWGRGRPRKYLFTPGRCLVKDAVNLRLNSRNLSFYFPDLNITGLVERTNVTKCFLKENIFSGTVCIRQSIYLETSSNTLNS